MESAWYGMQIKARSNNKLTKCYFESFNIFAILSGGITHTDSEGDDNNA
jgi:hypothetical protein